jgi:hypothetical protein
MMLGVQIDLAALPDDPATLQQMLREMVAATEQQRIPPPKAALRSDGPIVSLCS